MSLNRAVKFEREQNREKCCQMHDTVTISINCHVLTFGRKVINTSKWQRGQERSGLKETD